MGTLQDLTQDECLTQKSQIGFRLCDQPVVADDLLCLDVGCESIQKPPENPVRCAGLLSSRAKRDSESPQMRSNDYY